MNKFILGALVSLAFAVAGAVGPACAQVTVLAPGGRERVYAPGGQEITSPEQRAQNERADRLSRERREQRARQERLEQIDAEYKRIQDDLAQRLGEIDERRQRSQSRRR